MKLYKHSAGRPVTVRGASALALALALNAATSAQAQTASTTTTTTPADDEAEGMGAIVVTGSRIISDGAEAPLPLTVLNQEEILNQSPTNNIADFVNQLPSVAGSTRPANSRLNLSSGTAGINALNLRNLGETRTLVLLDGRRSVGSTITGVVDINTFPQQLISRVEVVTGGASATYGSDAVAGVVNFVLDREYEGLKVSADSGVTDEGDGANYSFSAAAGRSFADGRGHVLVSGELAHRDGIFEITREWNQRGLRTISNPDFTNLNGQPELLIRDQTGTSNALPGGIINASTGGVANSLRGLYFGQGGSVNQYNYGPITSSSLTTGGDWYLADNSRAIGLDAEEDRRNLYGRLSFELAPWIEVFGEASYSWQQTYFNAGPQFTTTINLQPDNAYLINTLGADQLAGITRVTIGTTAVDLPSRATNNERDVQRYALGAAGDFALFGNTAVWDVYAQYGQTNTREQLINIQNASRVSLATDAVFAPEGNALGVPAGTIVCRSTLTAPANGCVPLNRLGIGVTSQAMIDYVLGDPFRDQKLEQTVAGINLSTTPFATWAGDVNVALGAEYRKEEISGSVPTEFQTGWQVGNYRPSFGSYDVKEAYLETAVPVGAGITLNGAVRATEYSTSGYVTTWKAGAIWEPIEDIRIRATRSRDIRAPNLSEVFAAGTDNTSTITDPFRNDPRTGNPGLPGVTIRERFTGNPALQPEKADSTNVGVVLQPRFIPGLSVSVDGFEIKVNGAIDVLDAQSIINRCFEGQQQFCAAYGPDPSGDRELLFRSSPFNFARLTVRGVDFEAGYRLPLDRIFAESNADLSLRGLATRYIDNINDSGLSIPVDNVGNNASGTPKWIYRFSATYDTDSFSVTGVGRGVSSGVYSNSRIECAAGECPVGRDQTIVNQFPTVDDNSIPGTFYADLNLTAKVGLRSERDAEIFLQVTNLFDADPLLLPEGGLSANATYSDLLGRSFRIGVRLRTP